MVMSPVQLLMERRQIEALIKADEVTITLHRREKLAVPGGGWKWGPETELTPQRMALIPFKRRMTEFLVATEIGDVPDLPYMILGRYNLNIAKDDWFFWQGDKFEVQTVDIKQDVRIAAHVDYFGGLKNG
jgi:hypothetical protein